MILTLIGFILISLALGFAYFDIKRSISLSGPSNAEIMIKSSSALSQVDSNVKQLKNRLECMHDEIISNSHALKKYKESLDELDDAVSSMHHIQKKISMTLDIA